MKRAIFFLFVALVAVQITEAIEISRLQEKGLLSLAEKAIAKLKEIIEKAINRAKEALQNLRDKVQSLVEQNTERGKFEIAAEIGKTQQKLVMLRAQTKAEFGDNIDNCVVEPEENLKTLQPLLIDELVNCIKDEAKEILNIIDNTVKIVEDFIDSVKNVKKRIQDCNGKFFCITFVIGDIGLQVIKLPLKIAAQVTKVKDFFETFVADITDCRDSKVFKATIEDGRILSSVAKCVDEKYVNKSGKFLL